MTNTLYKAIIEEYGEDWAVDPEQLNIEFIEFKIIKETPCGYWFMDKAKYPFPSKRRLVMKGAANSYAYASKQSALRSLVYRKKRRLSFIEREQKVIEIFLKKAEELTKSL